MSYKIAWRRSVAKIVTTWGLTDQVWVEMHLRINSLMQNPADRLVRTTKPFDGMVLAFQFVDPSNRLCEHYFAFQVKYSQDEESLYIVRGSYARYFV